jgi:hypothetical protein
MVSISRESRVAPAPTATPRLVVRRCGESSSVVVEVPAAVRPGEKIAKWTRDHPVVSSLALVAVSVCIAVLIASQLTGKPRETLESAAIALVFVALIGGLVKIFLDDFQRAREKRTEQARFVAAMLADLKSVYDRVERARIVISAHKSAKTYGDEMRDLIDARVQLRNVERALEAGTSGISHEREEGIRSSVQAMEQYLATLTDEFESQYKEISDEQRVHEARVTKLLKAVDDSTELPGNRPWEEIQRLDHLSDFIAGGGYQQRFLDHLDEASRQLREEFRALSL